MQEDAAKNGAVADAIIVIAAPGTLPSELAKCGSGSGVAAVVSQEDGAKLLAALTASAAKELNGTFASIPMPGAFAVFFDLGLGLYRVSRFPASMPPTRRRHIQTCCSEGVCAF